MVMEKSPLFLLYFCLLPSIPPYSFALGFICPAHRHSSYCILPTVSLGSSSVIRIGSSLFTDSGYCTTEEKSRIYRIQGVSRLVDVTAGGDFLGLFDQKSSYKHVSDFGRLRNYGHFLIPVHALV